MKQKMTCRMLLFLMSATLGLTAQEEQPATQPAAQFEISPTAGKIKVDGIQDVDLTRSDRTFFLKIGYALGM